MRPDTAWRDWYRAQHDRRCQETGGAFEDYVSAILTHHHPDFINPASVGSLGDGGSDGLADAGCIGYASYGTRAVQNAERALEEKIRSDFGRALAVWKALEEWRFVTNARVGPLASTALTELQREHGPGSARPIRVRLWTPQRLWGEVVRDLPLEVLDELFPGIPHAAHVELMDLVPLLDSLSIGATPVETTGQIRPVPPTKLDHNRIPETARIEFNEGRLLSPRIDGWYRAQPDPDLSDRHGKRFRTIYDHHRGTVQGVAELIERLYTSLGGSDFRYNSVNATAVYAVTVYFFDLCHIFEEPPPDTEGEAGVVLTH
ncbi:ABC-three component system protein [Cellulomonas sp. CW35]|uniref:ABC-three component system protein n=1 Tax=Cellulomonas sp. CW35 TaxID=3458249 RepID=UPI004033C394